MSLSEYKRKRDFVQTPEPDGAIAPHPDGLPRFVIQLHQATRLHYDFRLEIDGVLKSWAVPKGPSTRPADKRQAMQTEDHPLDYRTFEGVIPKGNYGAGHVIVWDLGEFAPVPEPKGSPPVTDAAGIRALLERQLAKGELKFEMYGHKMQGRWALVHIGGRQKGDENLWLLIKDRDTAATEEGGTPGHDYSVLSGRLLHEAVHPAPGYAPLEEIEYALEQVRAAGKEFVLDLAAGPVRLTNLDKVFWPETPGCRALTKRDFILYHITMARHTLRHLAQRPLTLTRYPDGAFGNAFYQKDPASGQPAWITTVPVWSEHRGKRQPDGDIEYLLADSLATLVWLAQMGTIEIHPWISRVTPAGPGEAGFGTGFAGSRTRLDASALNYPDFILFDIDPYVYSGEEKPGSEPELHREGWERGVEGAFMLKAMLDPLGLTSFVKTSGKTGIHIHVPIRRQCTFTECRAIVETFVERLALEHPEKFTTDWTVEKRRGKIFLDKNQVVRGKNMAAAYCPRPIAEATVSMPLTWEQLKTAYPTDFTILTAPQWVAEHGDAWLSILETPHDLRALLGG